MDFGTLSDTQKVPKIFGEKEECLLLSAKHITAHHSLLERELRYKTLQWGLNYDNRYCAIFHTNLSEYNYNEDVLNYYKYVFFTICSSVALLYYLLCDL